MKKPQSRSEKELPRQSFTATDPTDRLAGQLTIEVALTCFIDLIGDVPVVMMAHNAGFDMGFLSAALSRLGMGSPLYPVIDTCALARRRLNLVNYKLETIGRHLRLINSAEHRLWKIPCC